MQHAVNDVVKDPTGVITVTPPPASWTWRDEIHNSWTTDSDSNFDWPQTENIHLPSHECRETLDTSCPRRSVCFIYSPTQCDDTTTSAKEETALKEGRQVGWLTNWLV